ncbi:hypothetical protein INT45_003169 [Circinella minor]|uniref:Uncharacterized protein n=1 Tax=Circinella minor TaxID=1195481 RepID=A0A8H7RRR5_9FUNG|nr:hypothetical protein INT45_003169 [Circinella minor]
MLSFFNNSNNDNKYDVTVASDMDVEYNGFVILPSNEPEEMVEDFVLLPKQDDLVYAIIDIYHDSITKKNLGFQLQQGLYKLQDLWEQDVKDVWRCALWIKNEIAAMS